MHRPTAGGASGDSGARPGSVGIGVLGARSMVARLAVFPAIEQSTRAHLVAACSLGGPVPDPWSDRTVESYEAVIDHPEVDAVYIPLPNGLHEEWVERCVVAGKHVLCEKPLAGDAAAARRMEQTADAADILLAEAWMTPFDPRWAEALRLASAGRIGRPTEVRAAFTFTIGPDAVDNYRWDPEQGGGALLDVGIYCLGAAVQLWGAEPSTVRASRVPAPSGVDASTTATLTWPDGETAHITCSFVDEEQQRLDVIGTDGTLTLDGDAHTGGSRAGEIGLTTADGIDSTIQVPAGDPYLGMIDSFADAVSGRVAWERPVSDSVAMLRLVERIARAANGADVTDVDQHTADQPHTPPRTPPRTPPATRR